MRESVDVKLLEQEGEIYILARSHGRMHKERGMRRRRLKRLWKRLADLQRQKLTRDQLLIKLGAAKTEAGRAWGLVDIRLPDVDQPLNAHTFTFALNRKKLRQARRREGRYLLRSNLSGAGADPTGGVREVLRHADGRRAPAHDRWAHPDSQPLHRAGERPTAPAAATAVSAP